MRTCTRCSEELDGSSDYYCKACERQRHKEWRSDPANAERWKASLRKNREDRFRWLVRYLQDHPCVDCGEGDPLKLQFDHVTERYPMKDAGKHSVPALARFSIKRAQEEIAKCEVRCANCHLLRHRLEMPIWNLVADMLN